MAMEAVMDHPSEDVIVSSFFICSLLQHKIQLVMVAAEEAVLEDMAVVVMIAAAEEDTVEAVEMITEDQEDTPTAEEATKVVVAAVEAVVDTTQVSFDLFGNYKALYPIETDEST